MGADVPSASDDAIRRRRRSREVAATSFALVIYAIVLAGIAFWPTPVDRGAGPFLSALRRLVPWLTYDRIEFGANVVMFVPFGVILAVLLRQRRVLVLPIAIAATIIIEVGQGLLLPERTASLRDVAANTVGAAVGLLIAVVVRRIGGARSHT